MYTVDQIVQTFSPDSSGFIGIAVAFAIANAIGLLEYIWACRLAVREKRTPFPVWMHSFMFAHDLTAGIVFAFLAVQYNFFWLFTIYAAGMLAWTCMEIFNLSMSVKYEAEETWGAGTSTQSAIANTVLQAMVMIAFVNIMRYLMNDTAMFHWLPMTNFVMAVAPGYILLKRQSRQGSSVMLYIFIVIGTAFNFAPAGIGLFTTAMPWVYDNPIWYAVGAVCLIVAVWNLVKIIKMPAKPQATGEKKPIW